MIHHHAVADCYLSIKIVLEIDMNDNGHKCMIIDSHCHLNYFARDEIDDLIIRAENNGVKILQTICTKIKEFPDLLDLATSYDNIYTSVGIHPSDAAVGEFIGFQSLLDLTRHDKVTSIGETGLDLYKCENIARQKKSFEVHIQVAQSTGLPLVIHTRDADEEMIEILASEMKNAEFTGVMHCFSSSEKLAMKALELGLYISFSGILTFKNAHHVRDVARQVPQNRTLIETDSPYLSPEPYRGQKNEPAMTKYVVERLAEVWSVSGQEASEITTQNCLLLFPKMQPIGGSHK